MEFMKNKESYAERRQLFKTIWETAMNIDEKEDIMSKPKVIKTLRLDEVDKCVVGKTKKQRIKNLRHVCKKILDFCDRQDADDVFYEQVAEGQDHGPFQAKLEVKMPMKKNKMRKCKKKVKTSKSMFDPVNDHAHANATESERKNEQVIKSITKYRKTSPIRMKRRSFVRNTRKATHSNLSPQANEAATSSSVGNTKDRNNVPPTRRKIVRRKHSKKKKPSDTHVSPPKSIIEWHEGEQKV